MIRSSVLILSALSTLFINQALAATYKGSLPVTTTVAASCSLGAVRSVVFGVYSYADVTPKDAEGSIVVKCPEEGLAYNVGLNEGTGKEASDVNPRVMTGPGDGLLQYGLFQDSRHSIIWGNTPGKDTVSGVGNGDEEDRPLVFYGRIPAGQNVPVGSYADTVTITVNF